ncbi:class I SAM-dependent methyltransferase [Paenibacillus sp. NEAU-GSW1]|uniref:class I SAM-dependent methyltransferase n=1 Tax=Paenibacillus sp. NEAU-GSW1 TaxID=2682486 RepID=UPI0012E2CAF2|nr:class I SAM-dependent methyltransferase [Paenibacillus sp. NEAU-GSW1]MUT66521.1 methyltransferase domain-containing protein [Paenibacillus sp. NEAU-GSW1]
MPDHEKIYNEAADTYDLLVSKQSSLIPVIEAIVPFKGLDIVDVGAGTGRLTAALAPEARSIVALDGSEAMLQFNASKLAAAGLTNWTIKKADNRQLPLPDRSADLIVSGWSISYLANTEHSDWEQNLAVIMAEFKRVLRSGGTIIIFETLGTGHETPAAPDFLKPYYEALVETYGFSQQWLRTDYRFDDAEQAERLTRIFFGDELAAQAAGKTMLAECAGVWSLQL